MHRNVIITTSIITALLAAAIGVWFIPKSAGVFTVSIAPELLTRVGSFPITNTFVMSIVISVLLIGFMLLGTRQLKAIPGKLQNLVEYIVEELLALIDSVTQDEAKSIRILPLIATIFLFVWGSNLIELVPGLGSVGIWGEHHGELILIPFIRSASADLNVTLALAITTVLSVQLFGIAALGVGKYAKKFLNFSHPIDFFVGLLELISEVARMISFSFRLFGNIFAGEVLLLVIGYLVPTFAPIPFLFLEIFVGFVQAFVFALLALVFIVIATTDHHEEAHEQQMGHA